MLNTLYLVVSIIFMVIGIIGTIISVFRRIKLSKPELSVGDNKNKIKIPQNNYSHLFIVIYSIVFCIGISAFVYVLGEYTSVKSENVNIKDEYKRIKKKDHYKSKLYELRDYLYSNILSEYVDFMENRNDQVLVQLLKNIDKIYNAYTDISDDSLKGYIGFYLNKYDNLTYVLILKASLEFENNSKSTKNALLCLQYTKIMIDSIKYIFNKVQEDDKNIFHKKLKDWIITGDLKSRIHYFTIWAYSLLALKDHVFPDKFFNYKESINWKIPGNSDTHSG